MMNKSAIDWCDFSWNPVTGCNFGCEYCYARRQATRFAGNTRLNMTNEQLKTDAAGLYILEQPFKNYNGAVLPFPAGSPRPSTNTAWATRRRKRSLQIFCLQHGGPFR